MLIIFDSDVIIFVSNNSLLFSSNGKFKHGQNCYRSKIRQPTPKISENQGKSTKNNENLSKSMKIVVTPLREH